MSATDGMHSFSSNLKCSHRSNSALRCPAPQRRWNPKPAACNQGRSGGESTGGFPEQSPVFLSRSLDLFSDRNASIAAAVDEEPAIVTPGNVGTALPVQTALPETPGTDVVSPNRPDWLPAGWLMEIKVRTNGATAGTRDRYFFDSVSKRRFRSRKEVFSFLTTGTLGRYKRKNRIDESDASLSNKSPYAGLSSKRKKFDSFSRPAKVRWVLDGDGSWTPFIGNEALSESTKRAWMAALDLHGNESTSPF